MKLSSPGRRQSGACGLAIAWTFEDPDQARQAITEALEDKTPLARQAALQMEP